MEMTLFMCRSFFMYFCTCVSLELYSNAMICVYIYVHHPTSSHRSQCLESINEYLSLNPIFYSVYPSEKVLIELPI